MAQRRINKQQRERIARIQKKHLLTDTGERGLVLCFYGKYAEVETANGKIYHCNLRQHLGLLTAGDLVTFTPGESNQGIIMAVEPRRTVLEKTDKKGLQRPVAANLEQMIIVIAPVPYLSLPMLDSYLVAAELLHLQAIIIINKNDILQADKMLQKQVQTALAVYETLPYPLLYISALNPTSLDLLAARLQQHTSVFIGQSGVGKSSLINHFIPQDIRIGDLSTIESGKHTTTNSRLYHLPIGGNLIDSPGVREFTLWPMPTEELIHGFIEFRQYIGQCRFRNCSHQNEKDCAIQKAVTDGAVAPSRLASLHSLQANQ